MTKFVTVLTAGFADWETALLNAAARSYYGIETMVATPGGAPVRSMGGMMVLPDIAIEDISVANLDVLLVCGGEAWQGKDAPDLRQLLTATHSGGKVIGAICDGVLELARSGLIDSRPHTGNGADALAPSNYAGAAFYKDQPQAVLADRIVTASGASPVSFMVTVLEAIGRRDEGLDFFANLHAAQFGTGAQAA